jgi:hypothetical protein
VALFLAVVLTVAVAGTLRAALDGSRSNRLRQSATAVAMERFEYARSLGWDELALSGVDGAAPLIDSAGGMLLASETGLGGDEPLLECATGLLAPRVTTTMDGVAYTVWTYVTTVSDALRRVVVLVTWPSEGGTATHRSDTVVSIVSAGGIRAVDQPRFPEAAIVATGDVFLDPGSTTSDPGTAHTASIWLNQSFSDLDAVVDGDIVAGGVVNATPEYVYGRIEQNAGTPVNVPLPSEIEAWRTDLKAEAQTGTVILGNQVVADTTITAPYYVDGTLDLQGQVHVAGTGPVYATGSIRFQAGAVVEADGAHLISDGHVIFEYGAELHVTEAASAGVVAFAVSDQALSLRGAGAGTLQGVAYAPYGGVVLRGTEPWHGALVAHGGTGVGSVAVADGSAVAYPANLLPTTALVAGLRPAAPEVVCG